MRILVKIALSSLLVISGLYAAEKADVVDINKKASNAERIKQESLSNRGSVSELSLGLRKTDLYSEEKDTEGAQADYSRPAPGSATLFERAFVNAPPMIPHSVEGLLPITTDNNQCLGCHMPDVAKGVGATAIPSSHFTNYRPVTVIEEGKVVKEGKELGSTNTSDVLIAVTTKTESLYQGRFNCSQCHAPQAKIDAAVGNTFQGDFGEGDILKSHSSLADAMNEGVE
ncbi:MAG: nitrate reductase cytochrome c-type subunit [Campylobacterota bacterium]|nr:nitrate reductase cytochrome c-type subunit [Campylobacterota bacterium]